MGLNGKSVKAEFLAGFVEALKGVDIVLVPDGDDQSSAAFKKLGGGLYKTAKSVRLASLPYGLEIRETGGDDVRDILRKFGEEGPRVVRDAIAAAKPIGPGGEIVEPPRFLESLVTSRQLADESADVCYLVDGILTAGEPGTVGGPAKCLKTLTMVDLVLSVASGRPFLDRFEVLRQGPVGFLSGESGRAVLRRAALRIAKSKGIDLRELPVSWGFSLPQLTVKEHVEALGEWITKEKLALVGLDPTYLCLLNSANAGQAGNLFAMGAALAPLSEIVQLTGTTVVLLHHYRKNRPDNGGEPADLQDLAMSGMMEWSRFWLLLDRAEVYANDGQHKLWMRAGGSAGHAGLFGLTIGERAGPNGDGWQVEVESVGDVRRSLQNAKEMRRAADLERREGEHVEKVLAALRQFPDGETVKTIRTVSRLNPDNTERALLTLQKDGRIEQCDVKKGNGTHPGFRLKMR
ncbi:MAG: AAA family ATPase [Pirellulales bacterium]|nr:AAA family ATPase [Pirellulales bacterium]